MTVSFEEPSKSNRRRRILNTKLNGEAEGNFAGDGERKEVLKGCRDEVFSADLAYLNFFFKVRIGVYFYVG